MNFIENFFIEVGKDIFSWVAFGGLIGFATSLYMVYKGRPIKETRKVILDCIVAGPVSFLVAFDHIADAYFDSHKPPELADDNENQDKENNYKEFAKFADKIKNGILKKEQKKTKKDTKEK